MDGRALTTVGVTGGIGSGKSTVARLFADKGARVIDADALSHALTAPGGAALPAIAAAFGAAMLGPDGGLDRARMRELAFGDPVQLRRLEAILHPMIEDAGMAALTAGAEAEPGRPVVCDLPLLHAASRWRARLGRVLVVDCGVATQIERVQVRSGWPASTIERIIARQPDRASRRALADAVILNDGIDLAELRRLVDELWHAWFESGSAAGGQL